MPLDHKTVAGEFPGSCQDQAGHEPVDVEDVGVVGGFDVNGSRVLEPSDVEAVDGVGTNDAGSIDDLASGDRARPEGNRGDSQEDPEDSHGVHGTQSGGLRRWAKVLIGVFATVFVATLAFAILQPIKVLPRQRIAPGFSLTDQDGQPYTSESGRGAIALYAFQPLDCTGECAHITETMARVNLRADSEVDLTETELRLVTVALADSPDSSELEALASQAAADSEAWTWVGGDWDAIKTMVGAGFRHYFDHVRPDESGSGSVTSGGISFDPGFVLVDGNGIIRGEYRYQTLADDADKLVSHIGLLADEVRLSKGAAALAYEAAHLFACYG